MSPSSAQGLRQDGESGNARDSLSKQTDSSRRALHSLLETSVTGAGPGHSWYHSALPHLAKTARVLILSLLFCVTHPEAGFNLAMEPLAVRGKE